MDRSENPHLKSWDLAMMAKTSLLVCLCLTYAATVSAAPSDNAFRQMLVGRWMEVPIQTSSAAHKAYENMQTNGYKMATEYYADGTAKTVIYVKQMCGQILATKKFTWSISDGVLTELFNEPEGLKIVNVKIVLMDDNNMTVASTQTNAITDNSTKIAPCVAS